MGQQLDQEGPINKQKNPLLSEGVTDHPTISWILGDTDELLTGVSGT